MKKRFPYRLYVPKSIKRMISLMRTSDFYNGELYFKEVSKVFDRLIIKYISKNPVCIYRNYNNFKLNKLFVDILVCGEFILFFLRTFCDKLFLGYMLKYLCLNDAMLFCKEWR